MDKMLSSGLIRNKKSIELFKFWGNKTMYEYYKSLTLPKLKNIITTGGNKVKGCDIQERKTEITQYKLSTIKKRSKNAQILFPFSPPWTVPVFSFHLPSIRHLVDFLIVATVLGVLRRL